MVDSRSESVLFEMRTLRLMIQMQFTQHILKPTGRFRHPTLNLFPVLQVFQMIQEQLCDESTLDDAAAPTVVVDRLSKRRVDLDTEVHQWHCATIGRLTSRVHYS